MGASPEFTAAFSRMCEIGEELLEIKRNQIVSALLGPGVANVVLETTNTFKIRTIILELVGGGVLRLRAGGIDQILVLKEPQSSQVTELEKEWRTLNDKWHIYP